MKLMPLCAAEEVWEGAIRQAALPGGHKVALYQIDGEFFATDDTCTHGAASLSEDGCVVGDRVECSWHNGQYDIRTGAACAMPCSDALKTWPLQIVDGQVCVLLPD
jgi:p-cumate 2,3-dioxygenase ferredoxin subunit